MKIKMLMGLAALIMISASTVYADEINVTVESVPVEFADQGPVIVDGRTLVPIRGVFETLGFEVTWNGELRQVVLQRGDEIMIVLSINSNIFYVNNVSYVLEVPAQLINGRTMIPIRGILENAGYSVDWDGGTNTVMISAAFIIDPVNSMMTFNESVADFSMELFRQALLTPGIDDENIVMSPLSAYYALSMVALGADGATLNEFSRLLRGDPNVIAPALSALTDDLMNVSGGTNLSVAGSVWVDNEFIINPHFNGAMEYYFDAAAFSRDFDDEETVDEINAWISENTNGLIPNALDEIEEDEIMILINTLYMYARWADYFRPMRESQRMFTPENGTPRETAFLSAGGASGTAFNARVTDNYEAVVLPYDDDRLGFFMVRPTDGTTVREFAVQYNIFEIIAGLERHNNVIVHMPEMDTDFDFSLNSMLEAMGLITAFDAHYADFSGLIENDEDLLIWISGVTQIVRIIVDSEGTEAAAVTIIGVAGTTSAVEPPRPLILEFNTPYIYAVYDLQTGIPLFIGIVDNPNI